MNRAKNKVVTKKINPIFKWTAIILALDAVHYTLKSFFIYKYSSNFNRNPHIYDQHYNFFGSKLQSQMEDFELRVFKDQFTSKVNEVEK